MARRAVSGLRRIRGLCRAPPMTGAAGGDALSADRELAATCPLPLTDQRAHQPHHAPACKRSRSGQPGYATVPAAKSTTTPAACRARSASGMHTASSNARSPSRATRCKTATRVRDQERPKATGWEMGTKVRIEIEGSPLPRSGHFLRAKSWRRRNPSSLISQTSEDPCWP